MILLFFLSIWRIFEFGNLGIKRGCKKMNGDELDLNENKMNLIKICLLGEMYMAYKGIVLPHYELSSKN